MSKRVKYSLEVKIKSVEMLLSRKYRICEIQKNTGANGVTIRRWVSKYNTSNTTTGGTTRMTSARKKNNFRRKNCNCEEYHFQRQ